MELRKILIRKNKSYFILGIIFIAISELIVHLDPLSYEPVRMRIYLFTVIPGILLIVFSLLIYKNAKLFRIVSSLCIIIFIIGMLRGCLGLGWETSGPFKDIKYYKIILSENNYPQSQSFSHFPAEIPQSATSVKMIYSRGFLQGEKHFYLSMVVDEAEFKKVLSKFNIDIEKLPKLKKDISFDELHSSELAPQSEIKEYWHCTIFRNDNDDLLPDDFYFQNINNKGIAVSLPRKEVIYWFHG